MTEAKRKETRGFITIKVEGSLGRLVLNRTERLNAGCHGDVLLAAAHYEQSRASARACMEAALVKT